MYQKDDGIVEFDPDMCIGCKACLQACPYDAIYIDPETGSAAKCHYCAHRVDVGLEPACVVVCPEHAIIAGDLDDPNSEISQKVAQNKVTVRKPEQGTAPKLFYIGGEDAAMHPTATERTPATFAWSDVLSLYDGTPLGDGSTGPVPEAPKGKTSSGIRTPGEQGIPSPGPIHIGEGRMAEQMVQVVWNAQHKVPWHWPVPAYLVTKAIASGLFLIMAWELLAKGSVLSPGQLVTGGFSILAFLAVTTGLLVFDLEHPMRFLRILTRPQWKSWLVRGAYLLVAFSLLVSGWWAAEAASWMSWMTSNLADSLRPWAMALGIPLAIGAAVYTAFLFGQAEGRDLWQNSLLPVHLLVQAAVAGAAFGAILWAGSALGDTMRTVLVGSLAIDLAVTFMGEVWMPHASDTAARAAKEIISGRYRRHFWIGSVLVGHVLAISLALSGMAILQAAAGLAALVGLYFYEFAFVTAPQEIPNS
ncbi:MAG: formate-dependent nitrite reductase membrane component NrfD/Pyruvate [Rhodothermales bacterium]|jgi:formate-dependent nitrite reductase membrane component NrfD/Pyruvate/2-oxoacid:ferredoxin oxidoreductase delta subunit